MLGIAARNGILLINHFQHLERHEGETFGPALVVRGAQERLSPILMTALATGLALVPLVIAGTIPGHEIEHPMALVILGGLVTSTLVNLFVVPSLYLRFGKPRRPGGGRREGAPGQAERRRSLSRMLRASAAVSSSRQSPTVAFGPTADTTPSTVPQISSSVRPKVGQRRRRRAAARVTAERVSTSSIAMKHPRRGQRRETVRRPGWHARLRPR